MAIEILSLDHAVEMNGLKILVHGAAGSGKTVLASTGNLPTIILSAEAGLLSLKKKTREDKLLSKNLKIIKIENFKNLEETYQWLEENKQLCDWLVLDSVSEIAEQILIYEKENNKDARAAYGNLTDQMIDIMRKFRDLPGYNVVLTCKQVRQVDEDTGIARYAAAMPGRRLGPELPYYFDEVFALRVEEDEDGQKYRVLQTDLDPHYYAKDRSGELEMFEEPNLYEILMKINPDYIPVKERPEEEEEENEIENEDEIENEENEFENEEPHEDENEEGDEEENEEEPPAKTKKQNKKVKEEKGRSVWRCCECETEVGDDEPEEGFECPNEECDCTDFYPDED